MTFTEGETIEGYEEFKNKITTIEKDKTKQPLYILFSGSHISPTTKQSWCADCNTFEGVWSDFKKKNRLEQGYIIYVKVGDQTSWATTECPFRVDVKLKLEALPTLMRWKDKVKLDGDNIQICDNLKVFLDLA